MHTMHAYRYTQAVNSLKTENREKKKKERAHTDLNHGPIDLQSIALPLSYTPMSAGTIQSFM